VLKGDLVLRRGTNPILPRYLPFTSDLPQRRFELQIYSSSFLSFLFSTFLHSLLPPQRLLGSLLFIEQKRMESQNATPSKMSVGRQFEEMCTVRKAGQDTTGGFTAVLHELDGIKILCFGEVDCKTDDQYIELKASASAPQ
jgi:hypothetical protein